MGALSRQLCATVAEHLNGHRLRPPEAGRLLWNVFQRLAATRTWHMSGPNALQPSEIEAFCRLTRLPLEPRHIAILMDMDRVWIDHFYATRSGQTLGKKQLPPVSQRPISAAILDAMMGK